MTADSLDQHRVEFKYQLDNDLADRVQAWARQHLTADEHCDPRHGDSYDIHTLYLDTESWDLYQRTDVIGRSKHRIRRYGDSDTLWLETKKKNRDSVVTKRRYAISTSEWLERIQQPEPSPAWDGEWFIERIGARALRPAVNVHYQRFAWMQDIGGQAMRLTIDHRIEASLPLVDWNIHDVHPQKKHSLGPIQILELKFNGTMPDLFKDLLQTFPLRAAGFSKFRSAVDAQGLVSQATPVLRLDAAHGPPKSSQSGLHSPLGSPQSMNESGLGESAMGESA